MSKMKDLEIALIEVVKNHMDMEPNSLLDNVPDLEREIGLHVLDMWEADDFVRRFIAQLEDCDWLIEEAEQHMKQEALERRLDKEDMERKERLIEEARQKDSE